MTKLAIVILNWNGRKYLEKFLPSLMRFLPDYAEIVVADNASSDDSVSFLKAQYHFRPFAHMERDLLKTRFRNQ